MKICSFAVVRGRRQLPAFFSIEPCLFVKGGGGGGGESKLVRLEVKNRHF